MNHMDNAAWIDCTEQPHPQDDNGFPFWVTLEDPNGMRRKGLVVMTEYGLCHCEAWNGESYGDKVTDLVTHWMPQCIPLYPAAHKQ